jgi:hypothetical protein
MTRMWWFVVPLVAGLLAGAPVNAADTVKIGVIYRSPAMPRAQASRRKTPSSWARKS